MGVTFSVDAGSSGCLNFHAFYRSVIVNSSIRVKAFLSCYSMGLGGGRIVENFDPALFDEKRIAFVKDEYPDCILGLKMRLSHGLAADIRPLAAAVEMAERIGGMRVCVHVTNPPADMRDIASILRSGDILCHMYHGTGSTILDKDGRILPEVLKARERGVIFDVANGSKNCFHKVALAAIREGFLPDIISTDMTMDKTNSGMHVRSLPFAMSKFLSMGISLHDVVKATTEYPAMVLNMQGKVGTLAPGAFADISILRLTDREVSYVDTDGQTYAGKGLLVPQMTIANGVLAFGQVDFNLA
jgi:predicted amidohydrolase